MDIENTIEEKKLNRTNARKELLNILSQENKPVSFEDVKDRLHMDKATFYRNVAKFESELILNSFESNDKKKYYELAESPHAHIVCNVCNTIECLKDLAPTKIEGYKIDAMIFKGTCKKCNSAK